MNYPATTTALRPCHRRPTSVPSPHFSWKRSLRLLVRKHAGLYLDAAALLGRRTAEMHLALATPTDNPAFIAESFTADDLPRTPAESTRSSLFHSEP